MSSKVENTEPGHRDEVVGAAVAAEYCVRAERLTQKIIDEDVRDDLNRNRSPGPHLDGQQHPLSRRQHHKPQFLTRNRGEEVLPDL